MTDINPADPITVSIGGEIIPVPKVLNFATLERVWPAVVASANAKSALDRTSACIAFLAGILLDTRPELNVAEIKKRVRINMEDGSNERPGLTAAMDQVLTASGLVPPGEEAPPEIPAAVDPTTPEN